MQCSRNLMLEQGFKVMNAIGWRYGSIVSREHDEGLGGVCVYLFLQRVFILQFLRRIVAQQVLAGASVGHAGYHRNDRIEQYLKVGARLVTAV